jgi:hypothetical protein
MTTSTIDRLAPLVAGLFCVGLVLAGVLYAAAELSAALGVAL